jgi:NAD(P)-dependent dehydrogenase (short-subunit alcohol dehydrogenase family)
VSDMTGLVALVTGGASGIGAATVDLLRQRGATVVAADIQVGPAAGDPPATAPTDADVRGAAVVALDVTDGDAVDALVASIVEHHGRLDVAVNAAGVSGTWASLGEDDPADWDRTIAVNLTGLYRCVRAELRAMLAAGRGAVVNVASAGGAMGIPGLAAYSASKHGVIGLTRSAALEVVRAGVRVNAVMPGSTRTPMLLGTSGGEEAVERLTKVMPIKRLAEPEEIARAIVWLASDEASYVTGEALAVDGGALAS